MTYKQKCVHVNSIEIPPCTNTATQSFTELALRSNICLSVIHNILAQSYYIETVFRNDLVTLVTDFHLSPSVVHFICIKLSCENTVNATEKNMLH